MTSSVESPARSEQILRRTMALSSTTRTRTECILMANLPHPRASLIASLKRARYPKPCRSLKAIPENQCCRQNFPTGQSFLYLLLLHNCLRFPCLADGELGREMARHVP